MVASVVMRLGGATKAATVSAMAARSIQQDAAAEWNVRSL
jgi:hypothetical protein